MRLICRRWRRATKDALALEASDIRAWLASTAGAFDFLARVGDRLKSGWADLVHLGAFLAKGSPDHEGCFEGEPDAQVAGDSKPQVFRGWVWRNWTRNYEVRPERVAFPATEAEISEIVLGAAHLRVVGGGHSFNDSPLSPDTLVSLDRYNRALAIDKEKRTARVQAGIRLRDLNRALWDNGLGLPVLGSTDAQSIGGLIATDLHGTGRDHGFLSEQVRSLRIVGHDGTAKTVVPGDPLFHAAFGALGTCGVVIEVELDLVPAFHLAKTTTMADRAETEANIDALLAAHDHVSFYYIGGADDGESIRVHAWDHTTEPLTPDWQAHKTRAELSDFAISAYAPDIAKRVADMDEDALLSNALAPDRRLVMPSAHGFGRKLFYRHDEIETGIPFEAWRPCLTDVMNLLRQRKFFSVVEVRFTPNTSRGLIGPGVGRRTAYIELATPLSQDLNDIYADAESIFRAYGGQPHLGKKTNVTARDMAQIHGDRFRQFQAARAAQDPRGKFLNTFTRRVLGD